MSHIIKIEKFEGPLDLLLQLIEAQELDISEVSLAQVTDQYVDFINQAELDPSAIADFLNIAARLLLLKSRLLLPFVEGEEEVEVVDLAGQLKMYRQFVEAAKEINKLWKSSVIFPARERLFYKKEGFNPPGNADVDSLRATYEKVAGRLKPLLRLPEKTIKKVISLREKIDHLANLIKQKVSFHFHESLQDASDNSDTIVSFLAVLELVKQRQIFVEQEEIFSNILIKKNNNFK